MNDENAPTAFAGEAVLYDYLKHLTSLCLFSLAGVAALVDKVHGRSAVSVIIALVVIGLATFCSFYATSLIVDSRLAGKPLNGGINLYRHASPLLLSIGIGMFLYLFLTSRTP